MAIRSKQAVVQLINANLATGPYEKGADGPLKGRKV